jgi:hypothetical protein
MPIALFHGGTEYIRFLVIMVIASVLASILALVLIFFLLFRWLNRRYAAGNNSENFFRETGETK